MGHERASATELGIAANHYLANNGEDQFNAMLFAGYIRRAKRVVEQAQNRQRNVAETQSIARERHAASEADADETEAERRRTSFRTLNPTRYGELEKNAEAQVPAQFTGPMRPLAVNAILLLLIRKEPRGSIP